MNKLFFISYFKYSKNHITSFIFIFPLLFLYELISFFIFKNETFVIRNSADSLLRDFFAFFYITNSIYYYSILFFIFILYAMKIIKDDFSSYIINVKYLFIMYFEGIILGLMLLFFLNNNILAYSINYYDNIFLTFYLCLGAGIWEEILFRFILINFLFFIFNKFVSYENIVYIISITLSGLIFSAFHYIGSGADFYTHHTFIVRFIGGVLLSLIYLYRGLGISCMTHFCYDLFLVSLPIIKII